jgi:TRAP-type C4-dicarboxylate transport system substrate-binding protein
MGLQDVTKYALGDGFWISHTTATYMNLRKWQALGPQKQKILMDAQLADEAEMGKTVAAMKAEEQAKLEKAGMTFTHLSPEEAKKWRRMANDTRFNALSDKISPEQMAKIKSMIVRQ